MTAETDFQKSRTMNAEIKEYIDQRDTIVEQKIKLWIMSYVAVQILALLPVIFFLGGIYQNLSASMTILSNQQKVMGSRAEWMRVREVREKELRQWAVTKGFKPTEDN